MRKSINSPIVTEYCIFNFYAAEIDIKLQSKWFAGAYCQFVVETMISSENFLVIDFKRIPIFGLANLILQNEKN